MKDVIIIGGGLSGLSTAFFLKKQGFDILLCEKSPRVGGVIRTISRDGFLIEEGPNTFMGLSGNAKEMLDALHLTDQLVFPAAASKKRYIYKKGRLCPLPLNPLQFLFSPILSVKGKLRFLKEPFVAGSKSEDEAVDSFFSRRLGAEVTEILVDPFVSGIYAGDIRALSAASAFPTLYGWEKRHGSILKGALAERKKSGERRDRRLYSFKEGLEELPKQLERWLGEAVMTCAYLGRVDKESDQRFLVHLHREGEVIPVPAKALVFATPAYATAEMIQRMDAGVASALLGIPYAPLTVFHVGYEASRISHPLDGFGFLIPRMEQKRTLGALWNSTLFQERAPEGHCLLTLMAGGVDPHQLFHEVLHEVESILGIRGKPLFTHEKRMLKAIPQYRVGHAAIVEQVGRFMKAMPGIFLTGNYLDGVSCPQRMDEGKAMARRVGAYVRGDLFPEFY